jgi:putative hydroxymethylpyrimidine transporter CytX
MAIAEHLETDSATAPTGPDERVLSAKDLAVLWGNLGIGLLVLVTGALLVPGLGFGVAIIAIVIGSIVGASLLALAGVVGARRGLPTMVLLRPVLGVRGSWFPSALNVMQLVGWTAVELWAMSFVADLVIAEVFGVSLRGLWLAIAAIICTTLAMWGPVGVTRVWMERFGAWIIVGICVAVTGLVFIQDGIGDLLAAPGAGGFPTFGGALDLVIAMPISWLPLVADYTRYARTPRAAFTGTLWGYLIANVWLYTLGAALVLGAGAEPSPGGIASGVLAIAGGSIAGIIFLSGLLVGETDEAFANIYSASVSLQNIFPTAPRRVLSLGVAAIGTLLAAWLTMERYEVFLFLIGSVFVPLFGVMAAAHASRWGDEGDPAPHGAPVRWLPFVPWAAGFCLYHWILPTGPGWWTERVIGVIGTPLADKVPWLGASIPSFIASFVLAMVLFRRARAVEPLESPAVPPGQMPERGKVSS